MSTAIGPRPVPVAIRWTAVDAVVTNQKTKPVGRIKANLRSFLYDSALSLDIKESPTRLLINALIVGFGNQPLDYCLNLIELHLSAYSTCSRFDQRGTASVVRRCRNNFKNRMQNLAGTNKFVAFSVIQVVVYDQQVELFTGQRLLRGCKG
jgi:hypothetical protein